MSESGQDQTPPSEPIPLDPAISLIYFTATTVDDIERTRIAAENRVRAMTQAGIIVPPELELIANSLNEIEKNAIKQLQKAVRSHPLGPWIKAQKGLGDKQVGRLLNAIGNPGKRKSVRQLWAYCGMHVTDGYAPKNRVGVKSNWNHEARMRIRLIAESCIKVRSGYYRGVYDRGREKYQDLEITDLHKHNRALRLVAKEILKDMWIEARRIERD